MKSQKLVIALSLLISSVTFAAGEGHTHGDTQPMHGGVVAEVKDIEYEFVAKADVLQLYVRDHGKPVNVSKATAKVTILSGAEKQEVELKPVGEKLEATGSFKVGAGTKVVAIIINNGKQSTVRLVMQ